MAPLIIFKMQWFLPIEIGISKISFYYIKNMQNSYLRNVFINVKYFLKRSTIQINIEFPCGVSGDLTYVIL